MCIRDRGKLAKQADGAVTVTMGSTVLLAAVTAAKEAKPDVDFMPLQVEYKEDVYKRQLFICFIIYPSLVVVSHVAH